MGGVRVVEVGVATTVVAAVGVVAVRDPSASWLEWAFGSGLALGLLALARRAVPAAAVARRERARVRRVRATSAEDQAAGAVAEERARLGAEIQLVVRTAVQRMGRLAEDAQRDWEVDPGPALRQVGAQGRLAVSELRRLLGLLRSAAEEPDGGVTGAVQAATPGRSSTWGRPPGPRATASWLAVAAGTVALLECLFYDEAGAVTAPLTVTAAVMVGAAATRPGAGAVASAAVVAVGALVGLPVSGGLWLLLGVCPLVWVVVDRLDPARAASAVLLLSSVLVGSHLDQDVGNAVVVGVLVGTTAAGAAAVRWWEHRARRSAERACAREAEIAATVARAVREDALRVARELHDVVSNAVGVMVLHAGAAESLRPSSPERALAALQVVLSTATSTLHELDALTRAVDHGALGTVAPRQAQARTTVAALVDRLREAGVDVSLHADVVPPHLAATVHRLAQEGLTNAVRHAPGSPVQVTIGRDLHRDEVVVEVVDDGPRRTRAVPPAGPGYGLTGCAERVAAAGGVLTAAPRDDARGFRLRAVLPVGVQPSSPVPLGLVVQS